MLALLKKFEKNKLEHLKICFLLRPLRIIYKFYKVNYFLHFKTKY